MSYSGSGNTGGGAWRSDGGVPPHAFDPNLQPDLFRGLLTRRVFAFLIDLVVLAVPVILAKIFIFFFGLITLTFGWVLFGLVYPATIIWAHLVRCAGLFPAGRHARRAVLGVDLLPHAPGAAARPVQRPQAAAARHHPGNGCHQQLGSLSGSSGGASLLSGAKPIDR